MSPDEAHPKRSILESIEKRISSSEASGMVIVHMPWDKQSTEDVVDKHDVGTKTYEAFSIGRAHEGLKSVYYLDICVLSLNIFVCTPTPSKT